jgi:hypothetical protein
MTFSPAQQTAHDRIWAPGTVVWFHGINPQPDRLGIVQLQSDPTDWNTLVLWEGERISGFQNRSYLMTGACDCGLCKNHKFASDLAPGDRVRWGTITKVAQTTEDEIVVTVGGEEYGLSPLSQLPVYSS